MSTAPQSCSTPAAVELYYYDELPAAERQQVAAHLLACPDCAARLHQFRRLAALLPDPARVTPADCARLLRRTRARSQASRPALRPLLAAAAATAALAILLLWPPAFRTGNPPQLTEPRATEDLLQIFTTLEELGDDEDYQLLAFDSAQ